MVARAYFDDIRSLGFAGISAVYAVVGAPLEFPARMICFSNNTQGDMFFTDDNTADRIFVAAGSFKLWDVQANMNTQKDDRFVLPVGSQFYVRQITAPVAGDVYIEVIY